MENTCELAGMVCFYSGRFCFEYALRQCTWCKKMVCFNHYHQKLGYYITTDECEASTTACDECIVLDKTIVLNGKIRHARERKLDETSEYFTQYTDIPKTD